MAKKHESKSKHTAPSARSILGTPGIEANGLTYPIGRVIGGRSKLKEAIAIFERRVSKEAGEEAARERIWKLSQKQFLEEKLPIKLKLSKEIFDWCRKFSRSREYAKLKDEVNSDGLVALEICRAGWEHLRPNDRSNRGFSDTYLLEDGSLYYHCSQSYIGGSYYAEGSRKFKTPEALARGLGYSFIKKLHAHLVSGKFEDLLAKNLIKGQDPLLAKLQKAMGTKI